MTKGGGGALTREKILASASDRFVCIVDESKLVTRLGGFPLPVEVIPMAESLIHRNLVALGGRPETRSSFVTDNGNLILDVHGLEIDDPLPLEQTITALPGVVTCGVFAQTRAHRVLAATPRGTRTIDC